MNITIDIDIRDKRWIAPLGEIEPIVRRTLEAVPFFQNHIFDEIELSLVFADDQMVQNLNKSYRDKNHPTNVLSFPQVDWKQTYRPLPFLNLGDEIFAFETILRESQEQNKSFSNHYTHLIIHGLLHLCGYDHIQNDEAQVMEALEIEILSGLSINNPYKT